MDSLALRLLVKERVCVLSIVLADGSPHNAIMHYSEQTDPAKIFFQTSMSVKTQAIQEKEGGAKAAVVVGLNEKDMVCLQMRGSIRIVSDPQELTMIYKIHYVKQPQAEKYKSPRTIFLEFTPLWWRYSDFTTNPEIVIGT